MLDKDTENGLQRRAGIDGGGGGGNIVYWWEESWLLTGLVIILVEKMLEKMLLKREKGVKKDPGHLLSSVNGKEGPACNVGPPRRRGT